VRASWLAQAIEYSGEEWRGGWVGRPKRALALSDAEQAQALGDLERALAQGDMFERDGHKRAVALAFASTRHPLIPAQLVVVHYVRVAGVPSLIFGEPPTLETAAEVVASTFAAEASAHAKLASVPLPALPVYKTGPRRGTYRPARRADDRARFEGSYAAGLLARDHLAATRDAHDLAMTELARLQAAARWARPLHTWTQDELELERADLVREQGTDPKPSEARARIESELGRRRTVAEHGAGVGARVRVLLPTFGIAGVVARVEHLATVIAVMLVEREAGRLLPEYSEARHQRLLLLDTPSLVHESEPETTRRICYCAEIVEILTDSTATGPERE